MKSSLPIGAEDMRGRAKLQTHEHLDCSPRWSTLLELHREIGFERSPLPFPGPVVRLWNASNGQFGRRNRKLEQFMRDEATGLYGEYLCRLASSSLASYLRAIVDHILPVMQTATNLRRITKERIEDAVTDGHIALELRFAPQLHLGRGMTLDEVMKTVCGELKKAPIPMDLTVCALRHEGGMNLGDRSMVRALGDLCIEYVDEVGCFDLAGGEGAAPGILDWWIEEAIRVSEARARSKRPIIIKFHLWETNPPTAEDYDKIRMLKSRLKQNKLIIGHGIRDSFETDVYKEVCPTSNVVTGQSKSFGENPLGNFVRYGHKSYLNTDGTTLTGTTLTNEYLLAQEHWGWGPAQFLQTNRWALEAMNLPEDVKAGLAAKLHSSWAH